MLENTFNEEYFRLENNIVTNQEAAFIDSENRLIITTPFITEPVINDVFIKFAGDNKIPENFNMIIDAITLFSTNPNCQNYLPLKIELGSKINVEFNDATFQNLNNYKVIVNPRINLETMQNRRYSDPENFYMTNLNVKAIKIVETDDDRFFYLDENGAVFGNDEDTQTSYRVAVGGLAVTFTDIVANEQLAIGWRNPVGSESEVYDIKQTDSGSTNAVFITNYDINVRILEIFLIKNNLIVFGRRPGPPASYFIDYYIQNNNLEYEIFPTIELGAVEQYIGFYRETVFYSVRTDGIFQYIITNDTVVVTQLSDVKNTINVLTPNQFYKVYVGGSNIETPNISFFTITNDQLTWKYYRTPYKKSRIRTYSIFGKLRRYRNNAYFSFDSVHRFLNLDNGRVTIFPNTEINYLLPRQNNSVINVSDSNFVEAQVINPIGLPIPPRSLIVTQYPNQRALTQVYKLTYNYDERVYLFDKDTYKSLFFSIRLPNSAPISDLEIFKYVIDGRIRYSKASIDPYGIVPTTQTDECYKKCKQNCKTKECKKNCETNCNKKLETDRILGLVGDDFNVTDFLNLYNI